MADPLIEARRIDLSVPQPSGQPLSLLRGLDLSVGRGEIVAVVGRSGSGKTSLLTLLGLMGRPQAGSLSLAGQDSAKLSDARAADLRNRLIGFVFQNYSLVPHLTVAENVALPFGYGVRASRRQARRATRAALGAVGLEAMGRSRPSRLSGGEQQRVAIARALVRAPSVLLADEPTGALDVETGREVMEVLAGAVRTAGACLVVVTHDLQTVGGADRTLELRDGRLWPVAPAPAGSAV
jgi:putative ABC transport system ATP-binding protein